MSEWIRTSERVPEDGEQVLIVRDLGQRYILQAHWTVARGWWHSYVGLIVPTNEVTHWMPLPPLPTDADEEK